MNVSALSSTQTAPQLEPAKAAPQPPAPAVHTETVSISAAAQKLQQTSGDVDHDGDSH